MKDSDFEKDALGRTIMDPGGRSVTSSSVDDSGNTNTVYRTNFVSDYDQQTANELPRDGSWIKTSFLIPDNLMDDSSLGADEISGNKKMRYWSTAQGKFTDTRLGGSIGVGAKPQFTRYADIRNRGIVGSRKRVTVTDTDGNFGMGRYYSEAIDDPSQRIYLRFGVPQFLGMTQFMLSAFNRADMALVKTGRFSLSTTIGETVGTVIRTMAFPMASLMTMAFKTFNFLIGDTTGKYYTVKPTMHSYWNTVQTLVEHWLVSSGTTPWKAPNDIKMGKTAEVTQEMRDHLEAVMPDVFANGNINVIAMANRVQRIANQAMMNQYQSNPESTASLLKLGRSAIGRELEKGGSQFSKTFGGDNDPSSRFSRLYSKVMNLFIRSDKENMLENEQVQGLKLVQEVNKEHSNTVDYHDSFVPVKPGQSTWENFIANIMANAQDGTEFAVFQVEHTGATRENFTNTTKEAAISSKLNSVSNDARSLQFSLSGGNLGGSDPLSFAIGTIVGGFTDIVTNVLSKVTWGISDLILGLAGAGYIDIPKVYDSSSAQLPEGSYTMQLVSDSGDQISRLMNLYLPFFMLLAGVLPRSTGRASYGPPFLCQLWDRGRCQIQTGMLTALSISRGTSNLPFNTKGDALAIDITFTVTDLSSIMHMPIGSSNMIKDVLDLDASNIMYDYLNVLGGRDVASQVNTFTKFLYNTKTMMMKTDRYKWSSYWASNIHDNFSWAYALPFIGPLAGIPVAIGAIGPGSAAAIGVGG